MKKDSIDERVSSLISLINKDNEKAASTCQIVSKIDVIPTGIYKLDGMIGGGIPTGCVSLFWGYKGSSKTTTCLRVIGEANKLCSACFNRLEECSCGKKRRFVSAYFAVEPLIFTEWSKSMGVDEDYLIVVRPETAEECLEVMVKTVESGSVDLIILDSIAALLPEVEDDKEMGEWQQGLQARIMGKFARKYQSAIIKSNKKFDRAPTLLLVNQLRQKIGVMYASPDVQPAGLAVGFMTSLEVKFWAANKADIEKDEVFGEKPISIDVNYKVDKRRYGPPKTEGVYKLALREHGGKKPGEIIDEKSVRLDAMKIGLIKKSEGKYRYGEIDLGKNLEDIDKFLLENKPVAESIKRAVVQIMVTL